MSLAMFQTSDIGPRIDMFWISSWRKMSLPRSVFRIPIRLFAVIQTSAMNCLICAEFGEGFGVLRVHHLRQRLECRVGFVTLLDQSIVDDGAGLVRPFRLL